jgi:pilus assembly protein Flp/PilA
MFIKLYSRTKRFFRASDGSSAVEYALLASLISLALILSVGLMGTTLSGSYEKVGRCHEWSVVCPFWKFQ